jgi:hypothetical protein
MVIEVESVDLAADQVTGLLRQIPVPAIGGARPMQWSGPIAVRTRVALPFREMDRGSMEGSGRAVGQPAGFPGLVIALPGCTVRWTSIESVLGRPA